MGRLKPNQRAFLEAFFSQPGIAQEFFLVVGTALSGFYLGHRWSDDIDLFCFDQERLPAGATACERCLDTLGLPVIRRRNLPDLVQLWVRSPSDPSDFPKLDLRDWKFETLLGFFRDLLPRLDAACPPPRRL